MPNYHPYFADLVLLMHLDGDVVDNSPLGQGFVNTGCTFRDSGPFKAAADINGTNPGGGGNNNIQSSLARAEYDFSIGDLTFEAFVTPASRAANGAGVRPIVAFTTLGSGVGNGGVVFSLYGDQTGTYLRFDSNGTFTLASSTASVYLTPGVRYHVAATRQGTTTRLFVNGVLVASSTGDFGGGGFAWRYAAVGNLPGLSQALHGAVDEVSACHSCLWTASFIPPTEPYESYWPAACRAWPAGMA